MSDLRALSALKLLLTGVLFTGVLFTGMVLTGALLQLLVLRCVEALPGLLTSGPLSHSLSDVWSMSLLALCTVTLEGPGPALDGACIK